MNNVSIANNINETKSQTHCDAYDWITFLYFPCRERIEKKRDEVNINKCLYEIRPFERTYDPLVSKDDFVWVHYLYKAYAILKSAFNHFKRDLFELKIPLFNFMNKFFIGLGCPSL